MVGLRPTEDLFMTGKFKYMKHIRPDPMYPDKWSTLFYPDAASLPKLMELKKSGIMNHLKMDDDGQFMNFSRPLEKTWRGKKEALPPPRVVDNGEPANPILVPVGNGSDGLIHLEVYSFADKQRPGMYKKAARWVGARIDNLVRYDPNPDYSEQEKADQAKMDKIPEALF